MTKKRLCKCGSEAQYTNPSECNACHYERLHSEHQDFANRLDVLLLEECETVDDLKAWIREHLLK